VNSASRCFACDAIATQSLPFPAAFGLGVCPRWPCLRAMHLRLAAHRRAVDEARAAARREQAGPGAPLVAVPALHARTAPLSARRRAAFQAHLDAMFAAAIADETPQASGAAERAITAPLDLRERRAAATACATCRGHCCRTGGTSAWIVPDTIRRVRRTVESAPEALRSAYLRDLPTRSYAGSCVYHTARGCALTPALRSSTCHAYLCDGAQALVTLARARAIPAVRVAATDGFSLIRLRECSFGSG